MNQEQNLLSVELQKEIDDLKRSLLAQASPEVINAMQRSAEELVLSGILGRCLKQGDKAPDFSLPNAVGREVRLSAVLEKGPAVVTFYRGAW